MYVKIIFLNIKIKINFLNYAKIYITIIVKKNKFL